MEPIIKIRRLTKTYQSKVRTGLLGSRAKSIGALKDVTLEEMLIAKTGRTLAEDTRVK